MYTGYVRDITDRLRRERELKDSRARIVAAADEARRRLERDLHDGAQSRLLAVALDLKVIQAALEDPADAERLGHVREELGLATDELRELARGIHPAALTAARPRRRAAHPHPPRADPRRLHLRLRGALPRARRGRRLLPRRRGPDERRPLRRTPPAPTSATTLEDTILTVTIQDDGRGGADPQAGSGLRGMQDRLAALDGTLEIDQPARRGHDRDGGDPVRVVIGEDSLLLREGIARVLEASGIDVVGLAGDYDELIAAVTAAEPDLAVVDIRMPPTHTDEGLRAAKQIRARAPRRPACSSSPSTSTRTTSSRCSATAPRGLGYMLKDRITDGDAFVDAVRRVAAGDAALDPEVVAHLLGRSNGGGPLDELTERERTVLAEMAEGRSNQAIAARMFLSDRAVERHVTAIFVQARPDRHAGEPPPRPRGPHLPPRLRPVDEYRCAHCGTSAAPRATHAAHGPEGRIASACGPRHWRLHHIGRTDHSSTSSRST